MVKFYPMRPNALISTLCGCLLLLSACASPERTERNIEERAMERWNTLLGEDLDGAYQFLSPGYRSSVSSLQYQRAILLNKVKWTGARYIESDCTETTCKVKISLDYALYGVLPGVNSFNSTQTVDESWVLTEGIWYFVPDK